MSEVASRIRAKGVNLKVSTDDKLYRQIKEYKSRHKVSIGAMVRDWMRDEVERATETVSK